MRTRMRPFACTNTKGFMVVVVEKIQAEAHHTVGNIAVETDGLPVVVGEVFAQLSIDVVGGEEGIRERPGQLRADHPVDEAGVFGLHTESGKPMEDTLIVGLFIGDEDKGPVGGRRLQPKGAQKGLAEGAGECTTLEGNAMVELECPCLLGRRHGARSAAAGMAEVEDELGMGSDGDGDFAREILRGIEGDKAIDTDIVIPSSCCKALGMEGDRLPAKPIDAIGQKLVGDAKVAAHGPETFAAHKTPHNVAEAHRPLHIVG